MQQFVPRCFVRIFRNECSRSTPLDPKLRVWCVSFHLGAFGTVSLLHKTCCKTRQTGAIKAKVRAMMSCYNFYNEHSQSTPLDPKLMFWCVSFHLGAFGAVLLLHETCCKTGQTGEINAKVRAIKSCRNFLQRHCQSTPLDPKLMFWCVTFRLGAFGTVLLLHETCCKTRQTGAINAKVRATKSCRNFSQRTLPIRTIGP